ncbi:MAG: glycosyltransferase [Hyphomicrobiales bacterium]|nr:glycosyltransferase [Hyphomicrobiales bacterium]
MNMPNATITFTRYNEPNWLVRETLNSLAGQRGAACQILFLDQQDDPETRDYTNSLSTKTLDFQYETIPAKSLSYARNCAIERAKYDTVLYVDCDVIAEPDWASKMIETLARPGVGVAGGRIVPKWHARPLLISRARFVLDQYSMLDLGREQRTVARIVGANFGLRRDRLGIQARFDETLGRRGGFLFGGEDTELCNRARNAGLAVTYDGRATVQHQVLADRIRYRWIFKRLYYAGIGRAMQGGLPAPSRALGLWDYLALPIVLPFYGLGYIRGRLSLAKAKPPAQSQNETVQ